MTEHIAFISILAAIAAFLFGCWVSFRSGDYADKQMEKSGVWRIEDRAYRLTKIDPAAGE